MKYNPLQARLQLKDSLHAAILYVPGSYVLGRDSDSHRVAVRLSCADIGDASFDHLEFREVDWLLNGQQIGYDGSVSRDHLLMKLSSTGLEVRHNGRHPSVYCGPEGNVPIGTRLLTLGSHHLCISGMPLNCTIEPFSREAVLALSGFPKPEAARKRFFGLLR